MSVFLNDLIRIQHCHTFLYDSVKLILYHYQLKKEKATNYSSFQIVNKSIYITIDEWNKQTYHLIIVKMSAGVGLYLL